MLCRVKVPKACLHAGWVSSLTSTMYVLVRMSLRSTHIRSMTPGNRQFQARSALGFCRYFTDNMDINDQVKLFLWCVPRSCSTAFSKAISKQENTRVVMEPYSEAYYRGEERVSTRFAQSPPVPNTKFSDIKLSLQNDYNEYSIVFAKDMAYYLREFVDRFNEVIPEDYQHTFLIRHPRKTMTSLYKASIKGLADWDYFDPVEGEFQTLHDLFFKMKEESEETPILVDADDLLDNPDRMLNLYCMKTGLPFSKEMLTWDKGGMKDLENAFPGWQSTLNQSTGFTKPVKEEVIELSEEAQKAIDDNLEYYNALYKYRLTL